MSRSDRAGPFTAFLPWASLHNAATHSLASLAVRQAHCAPPACDAPDRLDAYIVSCAAAQLSLPSLLERIPCSQQAALARVQRLVELGFLTVRRCSEAARSQPPLRERLNLDDCETVRPGALRDSQPGVSRESRSD
jgi:hypothetical protein